MTNKTQTQTFWSLNTFLCIYATGEINLSFAKAMEVKFQLVKTFFLDKKALL